jgi:flagellar protein FliS
MQPLMNQQYQQGDLLSATPQRLQFLLVDGAVRYAKQAGEHWLENDFEQGGEAMDRCEAILTEILKNIRVEQWEVAQSIAALYLFMRNLAVDSHFHHDQQKLAKLVSILEVERETWRTLCEQPAAGGSITLDSGTGLPATSIMPPLDTTTGSAGFSLEA